MSTVIVFAPQLSGTTGLSLYLRKTSDQSLLNAGGDSLTEVSTSGWFSATVAEAWTERLSAAIIDTDGLCPQSGWLGVGETVVSDVLTGAVELDSATQTQITNIENAAGYTLAVLAGECADPQTSSETYAITVFGSTFTVDMAGQTSTGTRTAPTLTKS
jgi:hypothetical protein